MSCGQNSYQLDTVVELRSAFTDVDGVTPLDPLTVTVWVRLPEGTTQSFTGSALTHVSTGVFTYDLTVTEAGPWIYKFQGQGNVEVTSPDVYFQVAQTVMPITA